MHLDLMRDKAKQMSAIADFTAVTSLRVWHCAYRTLEPLAAFSNLRSLTIATIPDASLEFLSLLAKLRYLRVVHLPKVTDLGPLTRLAGLQSLSLETLPSWDASGKRTVIESLEPISTIDCLEHLSLLGVVPNDRSLSVIEHCKTLRSARFHGFPQSEVARFFSATGISNAHNPEPIAG